MIVAWRAIAAAQRSKEVRTQGTSRYKRKAHFLGNAEGGTRLYAKDRRANGGGAYSLEKEERKRSGYGGTRQREGGSLPGDRRGRDKLDYGKKRPSVRYPRPGDHGGRHKSGHEKEATERRGLTDCRPHRERQVKAQKESNRAERHSRSGDHGGGYKSEHEKEATE